MRRLRHHPLIVLLCALCLLGAQQAANAHFIGHVGTAAEASACHQNGDEESPALDRICTTCAAFAALSPAPPSHAAAPTAMRVPGVRPPVAAPVFVPVPAAPPYASRAPPAVL